MKHHAWIAPREAIDDGRDEARAERRGAPDPHLARGRVGEELDVLDALPQLIEGSMAATEYGAPVFGEFDAVRISLQETHSEGSLIERETTGWETAMALAAFAMLPNCATARRMCRSLSLIRRPIRSFQRMSIP